MDPRIKDAADNVCIRIHPLVSQFNKIRPNVLLVLSDSMEILSADNFRGPGMRTSIITIKPISQSFFFDILIAANFLRRRQVCTVNK